MDKAAQKTIDLTALSAPQLSEVKNQLEQEVDHLSQSFSKLRQAQTKFKECIGTVQTTFKDENDGRPLLVPLTNSLYVPGTMADVQTVLVDVGTGYYVEKSPADAMAFYGAKVNTLQKNLTDLENIVNTKLGNLKVVEDVLRQKVMSSASDVA
ncbi:Prefoldin [Dipodascopsis tothii]|uniref:Prefoldin n=1 Tax=Dipodascopsis tothii TaxID=44089 RepID=UPI0034CE728C